MASPEMSALSVRLYRALLNSRIGEGTRGNADLMLDTISLVTFWTERKNAVGVTDRPVDGLEFDDADAFLSAEYVIICTRMFCP